MKRVLYSTAFALSAVLCIAQDVFSTEISVMSTTAVKEAVSELLPRFEAATGHAVKPVWDGTAVVTKRIADGEAADIVIVPASAIDSLIKQGRLAQGSRLDFVNSKIGIAVRPGTPKPDISSADALINSLLSARSILLSAGPSGGYLTGLFKRMGVSDALASKIKQLAPGKLVGEALLNGEGDLGFTQISEFLMIKGVDYVGSLPEDIQMVTVYSIGRHASSSSNEAPAALIKFLTTREAAQIIRKSGLEPAFSE